MWRSIMMGRRIATALIGLPLLLAIVWIGDPLYPLLLALVAIGGVWEFYGMARGAGEVPWGLFGVLYAALFILNAQLGGSLTTPLLSSGLVLSLLWFLFRGETKRMLQDWALTLLGPLYVAWLLSYFVLLRSLPQGREWVLMALLATFACDTAAFLVGRAWGRHPLAPAISPGKTWEGGLGGLLVAPVAVLALSPLLRVPQGIHWLLLGLLIGVVAQLGDLAESMLKRSLGVKDAGSWLPGHGGLLDRMDSLLFSGVAVYYYVIWAIR